MTTHIADELETKMAKWQAKLDAMTPEQKAEMERAAEESKEESRRMRVRELRMKWGAPQRHVQCQPRMEGEWAAELAKLKPMLEPSRGRIIALVGGRGNGKTQMAVELMKERTLANGTALFASAVEFFIKIKSTYRKDSDTDEMEVLREYQKTSLLVIDEIGKRGGSEWENTMLFELLNRRYNDMTDTILIDNRARNEFIETIGPSLASRMNEGGGIIECNWASFRG